MNHRKTGRKLGRTSAHRKALFRNMVTSLLEHEQIRTTDAKAKVTDRTAHAPLQFPETARARPATADPAAARGGRPGGDHS